jgi:murein DD-endopeptidase MepM/ murein hydrolase activator NlpD
MNRSHWTFLYVPDGEGGVRTLNVSKRLAKTLGVLCVLLVIGVSMVTVSFVRQQHALRTLDERNREVLGLRSTISDLEDAVSNYELVMAKNRDLHEQASLLAGLGPLDDLAYEGLGQGGQEPFPEQLGFADPTSRERVRGLRLQIDRLLREANWQKNGFEQVLATLQDDQELRDSTPSVRPISGGYLSSRYGRRLDPFTGQPSMHRGLDFAARVGTPVIAPAAGRVKRASRRGSLGLLIEVDHGNGLVTRYGHLDSFAVGRGDWVTRGQIIGRVGNTGRSTGSHLHYEVVQNGRSQNPWLYIIND